MGPVARVKQKKAPKKRKYSEMKELKFEGHKIEDKISKPNPDLMFSFENSPNKLSSSTDTSFSKDLGKKRVHEHPQIKKLIERKSEPVPFTPSPTQSDDRNSRDKIPLVEATPQKIPLKTSVRQKTKKKKKPTFLKLPSIQAFQSECKMRDSQGTYKDEFNYSFQQMWSPKSEDSSMSNFPLSFFDDPPRPSSPTNDSSKIRSLSPLILQDQKPNKLQDMEIGETKDQIVKSENNPLLPPDSIIPPLNLISKELEFQQTNNFDPPIFTEFQKPKKVKYSSDLDNLKSSEIESHAQKIKFKKIPSMDSIGSLDQESSFQIPSQLKAIFFFPSLLKFFTNFHSFLLSFSLFKSITLTILFLQIHLDL